MKRLVSIILTLLIGMVLNVNIVRAEDPSVQGGSGDARDQLTTEHKTKVDPAREARRMNYLRGRMMLQPEQKLEEVTPVEAQMSCEECAETKATMLPPKSYKVFRK